MNIETAMLMSIGISSVIAIILCIIWNIVLDKNTPKDEFKYTIELKKNKNIKQAYR